MAFRVIEGGALSLIQDLGRFGQHHQGLTTGGPIDEPAFYWANRLVNNPENTSTIEITLGGLTLQSEIATFISVTGADMPLTINGIEKPLWQNHPVNKGDLITLGYSKQGCRCYLAVAGGFNIAPSFGSSATVLRESIGGLSGKKLTTGDLLACKEVKALSRLKLPTQHQPSYHSTINLRVILGYQAAEFSSIDKALFFSSDYKVSNQCDRMGYRLQGKAIYAARTTMLSEGICLGAIQMPADGQPIVLMHDRQTIGGYPKLGAVLSLDLAKLGQSVAGAIVNFSPISHHDAHNLLLLEHNKRRNISLDGH